MSAQMPTTRCSILPQVRSGNMAQQSHIKYVAQDNFCDTKNSFSQYLFASLAVLSFLHDEIT
jgi:hypothetical protein